MIKFIKGLKIKFDRWRYARKVAKGKVGRGRQINDAKMLMFQWARLLKNQFFRPLAGMGGAVALESRLMVRKIGADGLVIKDYGIVCTKKVTTAFVNYLVDGLQSNTTDVSLFRFHASGTGAVAESNADTALGAEAATRVSGTQTEGASANIYRTVATIPYTGTLSITEHGVFSAASAGTLMDRSVFASIGVVNGESIEFTYELTAPAEA